MSDEEYTYLCSASTTLVKQKNSKRTGRRRFNKYIIAGAEMASRGYLYNRRRPLQDADLFHNDETEPPLKKKKMKMEDENNRGNPPEDPALRCRSFYMPHRTIELITQTSTITYPTPTYTSPPWPTPTCLTLANPVLAYPPPIIQVPAVSQLIQPNTIRQIYTPQMGPRSPPFLPDFQISPMFNHGSPPPLLPLTKSKTPCRPLDIEQQSTNLQPTNSPTSPTYVDDRSIDLTAPIRPVPTLIPIHLVVTRVYSGSAESPTPIPSPSCKPSVTSPSSQAVDIQSSNIFQFENIEIETTTNQIEASIDSSTHSSNRTTGPGQPNHDHAIRNSTELSEHEEYQLWPGADTFETDHTEEVRTLNHTEYDDWLDMESSDSTDRSKAPSPLPISSSDTDVPVRPLTPAPPSDTTPLREGVERQRN